MYIIGELINGMYQDIGKAIQTKDKSVIQKRALEQVRAGADALDVNCGPASKDPLNDIQWLINSIQEVTDKAIAIDSSRPQVIESGLKAAKNKVIINSTTADQEKLDALIPLALKYNAKLIGLTIGKKASPEQRPAPGACGNYCGRLPGKGFPIEDIYLDPIVMPLNVAQSQMKDILESIHDFKIISDPAPKTVVGLSNVSQGTC